MAATAEYLAEHPFASPDIVNPPEAPTYRYRPDIETIGDFAAVETDNLSGGSRIDIVIDNALLTYILQEGEPTGSDSEIVPDDYDIVLNQQFWLLVASGASTGTVDFSEITGTLSLDQLPVGSVATVSSIGEDALYFFTDSTSIPSLASAVAVKDFLDINFSDIIGTLALEQMPVDSVVTLDSIDEDGLYFFNNSTFAPELIGQLDALIFLLPDQTGEDGKFLQTTAGVLSWETASGGGGSIASTTTFLMGDGAGAAIASGLSDDGAGDLTYQFDQNNQNNFEVFNATNDTAAGSALQVGVDAVLFTIGAYAALHTTAALLNGGDSWLWASGPMVIGATGAIRFANDGVTTERVRINNGLSVGSTTDPGAGNILLNGLTASGFVKTDGSKILVSKTASEMRTDLALVIGTNVQAYDADLDTWATKTPYAGTLTITTGKTFDVTNNLTLSGTDGSTLAIGTGGTLGTAAYTASGAYQPIDSDLTTIAGLTATTDNFIVSVSSAWASRTPTQVKTTLGLTIGTNVQAWDADLDTLAGLTATTDNFIVSVSSAWASRTPTQVLATLAAVGTTFQPLDSDLTTIAGLTATTDNFIVSVSSAWASRTPSQVRTTLGLVIGTNVQAWDADLDTLAGLTATTDNFVVSVSSAWASRTPSQVRTTLGLVIGTNVQAWDADLDTWAGITPAANVGTFLGTPSSANLRAALTDENGTGVALFDSSTSATFITPLLGTPTSGDLRNCSAATDSIAGVMSAADHTTLTLLSTLVATGVAPTVAVGVLWIAQVTGVNLKTNAVSDIFTVPASKNAVILGGYVVPTSVTGGAAVTFTFKIQESSGSGTMSQSNASASGAPVTTKFWDQSSLVAASSPLTICAAGNKVQISITTGFTTSTTVTGTVYVIGFYVP